MDTASCIPLIDCCTINCRAADDLLDAGETCSENRVARLASLAVIAAQIGYKRRPGRYGGKPAVVADNTLDRQFEVPLGRLLCNRLPGNGCPRHSLGDRHHIYQNPRRVVVSVCRHRPVLKTRCRMVHAIAHDNRPRFAGPAERRVAA